VQALEYPNNTMNYRMHTSQWETYYSLLTNRLRRFLNYVIIRSLFLVYWTRIFPLLLLIPTCSVLKLLSEWSEYFLWVSWYIYHIYYSHVLSPFENSMLISFLRPFNKHSVHFWNKSDLYHIHVIKIFT
jgi:hypothetical protein